MINKSIWNWITFLAFFASVQANSSVDLYGEVTLGVWMDQESDFTKDTLSNDTTNGRIPVIGTDPFPVFFTDIQPVGSMGLKISYEKLQACFEFGIGRNVYDTRYKNSEGTGGAHYSQKYNLGAKFNKFYAKWNFNDNFSLLFGKDKVPCNFSISNQALYGGNGFTNSGVLNAGSRPMIVFEAKAQFGNGSSVFGKIAGIVPDTVGTKILNRLTLKDTIINGEQRKLVVKSGAVPIVGSNEYKPSVYCPKFEGATGIDYTSGILSMNFQVAAGYQVYDLRYKQPFMRNPADRVDIKEKFESYIYGTCGTVKVGPATLGATYSGGKNLGLYGVNIGNPFKWREDGANTSSIVNIFFPYYNQNQPDEGSLLTLDSASNIRTLDNSFASEMAIIGKCKIRDYLSVEGGIGLIQCKHDNQYYTIRWKDTYAWYGQIQYTLANILTFTPEIGVLNYGPLMGQGTFTYYGLNVSTMLPNVSLK